MANRLPVLNEYPQVPGEIQAFVNALEQAGFIGDVDISYSGRMVAATDNSIYQQLPQAVLYPKSQHDVRCIFRTAARTQFKGIRFSPRGGGTGTNGQSLTPGVVIDLSRYLTKVLELNLAEGWVRVEAGIVKDQLNAVLAEHGYFFAPDTSTSNRCTIGGMIATDASGQGSLIYGKTSDHVLGLRSVLVSGEELRGEPVSVAQATEIAQQQNAQGAIYRQVLASCKDLRPEIEAKFPPLNRFLTGYDLAHAYDAEQDTIDVSRLICGAEGTLALVTEAKLNITPSPNFKVLVNVKYQDFSDALRHAPALVKARATSVETIDSNVLDLARNDIVWHEVEDLLTDVPPYRMGGINILEFTAVSREEIGDKVKRLLNQLQELDPKQSGVIGYQICRDEASIQKIYAMRKKAVGLLGATKGKAKPVAFVEDTAVPPEKLADFIMEFRALLDSYGLHYGMFGHVDAGVLHVRPALDMQQPESATLVREVSDRVMQLTARFGGLMWGEHGKGYRSEYGPEFFGEQLFNELRKLKAVFDPHNRLNPGKICTPIGSHEQLVSVDARKRGWFDRQIPLQWQAQFQGAMDCNGNGLCFSFDANTAMCPSYRATGDRRFSPKGRATLLREWLRLRAASNITESDTHNAVAANAPLPVAEQKPQGFWQNSRLAKVAADNDADFSHQVREAMDTCLACKACTSQCPVKVDIPSQRANFYADYHQHYRRPLRDYMLLHSERTLARLSKTPRLANLMSQNIISRWLLKKTLGYVDAPRFSVPRLARQIGKQNYLTLNELVQKSEQGTYNANDYVLVIQDVFTSAFNAEVVRDFMALCRKLEKEPVLVPFMPNGKTAHVKGFLAEFSKVAHYTAAELAKLSRTLGAPMVGLDAATTLCFRDEYRKAEIPRANEFKVLLSHEYLSEVFASTKVTVTKADQAEQGLVMLPHCTEQTALPGVAKAWQRLFAKVGVQVDTPAVGCCGMAGTFGHELEQQATSATIFSSSWQPHLERNDQVVASGFSCRCQSERLLKRELMHPVQTLLRAIS